MGDWVIDMQQDMVDLTRDQFVSKHGDMSGYLHDEFGENVVRFVPRKKEQEDENDIGV
jgi:hypothetical protein